MFEVTDDMYDAVKDYVDDKIDNWSLITRIIELHEENKPKREPLSNNELLRIFEKMPGTGMGYYTTFARAVEKAHGIGVSNGQTTS